MGKANPFADTFSGGHGGEATGEIASVLGRVRLAPRQVRKEVTLWPLILSGVETFRGELWPLDEALDDGFVGVARMDGAGGAWVESRAPVPVWIPGGEPVGGEGFAAESRVLPAHGSAAVPLLAADGGAACGRCCRGLAAGFRPVEEQVGFVLSVQDRAVALELVLPAGLLSRRLRRRVEAWAPLLLSGEVEADAVGFDSPEGLLAAVAGGSEEGLRGARVALIRP